MNHVAGMDLGSMHDFSTLAIVEILDLPKPEPRSSRRRQTKRLMHLHRWPLELPYDAVIEHATAVVALPPFKGTTKLVYDRTGLGSAVAYQFREAHQDGLFDRAPRGFAISGGDQAGAGSVPKVNLVDNLRALIETKRLSWPSDLPLLDDFLKEMAAFAPRPTKARRLLSFGNDPAIAAHDDLVMAVALAVWYPGSFGDNRYIGRDSRIYDSFAVASDPY